MYALRPAIKADADFLFRVYSSTRERELSIVPWSPEQKAVFLRMQYAAQEAHYRSHYPGASFDVILVGDEPAGRLAIHRIPTDIRVVDISLLPEFRNRGIGKSIFTDLLAEADRANQEVSLHVEPRSPARRLYDRLGFRAVVPREDNATHVLMRRGARGAVNVPGTIRRPGEGR